MNQMEKHERSFSYGPQLSLSGEGKKRGRARKKASTFLTPGGAKERDRRII